MNIVYSYNSDDILFGKYENLLNAAKSFSDIKIGLGAQNFQEIIPFVNIAYTDDYVVGINPYHVSSESLNSFHDNQLSKYKYFNCFFLYYSNLKYINLRSSQNFEVHNEIGLNKNIYSYYNWHEKNLDNKLLYNSIKDRDDPKKIEKLIDGIHKGYDLKIRLSLNGVTYILTPTIKYYNFDNNQKSLSIKTHPFIDISEIEKNNKFIYKECLIDIHGNVSILQTKEYFPHHKKLFFAKIFNFFLRKLGASLRLSKRNIIKNQNFQKQNIEWFLY